MGRWEQLAWGLWPEPQPSTPPPPLRATAHRVDGGVQGPGWEWSTPHAGGKTDDNRNEGGTNNIRTENKGWGPGMQVNDKQGVMIHGIWTA
jgi:hypothetical protein